MKLQNKKGAEMTIGTIIVIILALVVLVFLIFGFTTGWSNLWQKIINIGSQSNVQTHVQACQIACTTQSVYDYCKSRKVRFEGAKEPETLSCKQLEARGVGLSCSGIGACPKSCQGTPTACAKIILEEDCGAHGCTFNENPTAEQTACSETPAKCEGRNEDNCKNGCEWK